MKLTRLSLLLVALLVSALAAPDAFAAKQHRHGHGLIRISHKARSMAKVCDVYDIYCDGENYDDSCCGNLKSCLSYCADVCGGACEPF